MVAAAKTCLITGCSGGGVGAAFAEIFKNKGYHVFATARSPSKVPQALHDSPNVTVMSLDVASSESIATAAEAIGIQTGGKLDVLINNAGSGMAMPALDVSISEARKLFDINFFGALEMIQVFSPMLIKAKGCIVNNSSVGGSSPLPFNSIYAATKASLTQASEIWRLELAPLDVRVIALITGGISTQFLSNLPTVELPKTSYYLGVQDIIGKEPEEVPFGVKPEDFAKDVLHYVESGKTGKIWIGGGVNFVRLANLLLPQGMLDRVSLSFKPFTKKVAEDHKKTI